jgi:Zn-dependent M28 family amino/carboxypeptidase
LRRAALIAAALLLSAAAPPPAQGTAADRIRADVEFLASDLLEGRDTGSRGHAIAADFVASRFRAIGLKPGTNGSWFQQVPFRRASHVGVPRVALVRGARTTPLTSGTDFALDPSLTEQNRAVDAPLVFVGHGISDPGLGVDDYRGLDVRGKIVVALPGSPSGLPTEIAAHLRSMKDEAAASHGAIGFIELTRGMSPAGMSSAATRPRLDWIAPAGSSRATELRANMTLSPAGAERLFAGAKRSLNAVRTQAAAGKAVPGFALPSRLTIASVSSWQDFPSSNVIGLLPGGDPRLAAEHVVLMGHLDHLANKTDAKPGEDAIHNGALDNAAGIATMLEAARTFVASGKPPRRSVLFIANTGEEKGLLGADYFAANPTVPVRQIVGAVDLDMPVLLYDFTDVIAFGADHSTVAETVATAARSMNVSVAADPMPQESIFVRSDHYRFVLRGIPAILLMTGYANGGKAQWERFLGTVYHSPKDDLSQPINWAAGARYGELNYRIARALADADERPRWYANDYFGDRFAPGQPRAKRR